MWQRASNGSGGGGSSNRYCIVAHNGELNYAVIKDGAVVYYSYYTNPGTYEDDYIKIIFGDTMSITLKHACVLDDYFGSTLTPTTTTYTANTTISKPCRRLLDIQFS